MPDVEIDGHSYNIGRLNAFQQFDLGRKVLPFLPAIMPALRFWYLSVPRPTGPKGELVAPPKAESDPLADLGEAIRPMAEAMAGMKREDSNFILNLCLDVVRRRDANGALRPVRAAGPLEEQGVLFYENDMDFMTLMRLAMEVILANLGPILQKNLPEFLVQPTGATTTGISTSPTA